jgi:hypothetical protein
MRAEDKPQGRSHGPRPREETVKVGVGNEGRWCRRNGEERRVRGLYTQVTVGAWIIR